MICSKHSECRSFAFEITRCVSRSTSWSKTSECDRRQYWSVLKLPTESMNALDCPCTTLQKRDRLTSEPHISAHHKGESKFACVNLIKVNQYTTITGRACMTACITTGFDMKMKRKKKLKKNLVLSQTLRPKRSSL